MNSAQTERKKLTWKQGVFLVVIFPLLLLAGVELTARGLEAGGLIGGSKSELMKLDMPAWMVKGTSKPKQYSREEVSWMNLFESGDGFRVRMKPNVSQQVEDTFSWVRKVAHAPFVLKSNSYGFRSEEFTNKKDQNTFRIALFGDSSSFGWGVNAEENYLSVLTARLKEKFPERKFEAYNLAMPGDSSEFGRLIFDKYLDALKPDLVLISFGANDARRAELPHPSLVSAYKANAGLQSVRAELLQRSAIARTIDHFMTKPRARNRKRKLGAAVRLQRYRENLFHFNKRSLASGAEAVGYLSVCSPAQYAERMQGVAHRQNAVFLNGQKLLRESIKPLKQGKLYPEYVAEMQEGYGSLLHNNRLMYVSNDGCHPNRVGHRIIGEALADRLMSREKIIYALKNPAQANSAG